MKNVERLNDPTEVQIRGISSGHLMRPSQTWLEVADVMSKDVATISSDDMVVSAAKMMSEKKISCIVVMDNGNVAGILTETDVLRGVAGNGKDFYETKLGQIMSSPVESVPSDVSVLDASKIMGERHIKRLPILEKEKLIGIVTQTDLVRALTSYGLWRDVSEIMNRNVAGIQRNASVAEAAEVMTSRKISCITVLDANEVAGVLTEKDLLGRVVALQRDPACVKIEDVMSSPVKTISPSYSVFSASRIMEEMNIRRLVVMDDKRLYGMVTQTDIFMAVRNKLQAEEEKNFRSLEASKSNIYIIGLDGVTTYANPAFMKLLEVSDPAELTDQPFLPKQFWFNPEDREQFLRELKKGTIESKELTLKTSTGKKIYVTVFSSSTKDIHGQINGSQGVVYDITDKKELVALREAEEELEKLNKDLESSVQKLARANRELQEFAYIAAHDLKTPLRAIGTLADWLLMDCADKFDEKGKKHVNLLIGRARQMIALVDDILQYSRVGQSEQNKREVDLGTVLSEAIGAIDPPEDIEITIEDELPVVICEKTHMTQVFGNLLSNAVKYVDKPKGQIKVGCVEEDGFWRFSVADNGSGIDQKYFKKIFKMFQTLSPRGKADNTGIGLSIVKKVVELNGGRVWVESEVSKGSTFFFTLPKQDSDVIMDVRTAPAG